MSDGMAEQRLAVRVAPIDLERDEFLRDTLSGLTGLLEGIVGLDEALGCIKAVGRNIGNTRIFHTAR